MYGNFLVRLVKAGAVLHLIEKLLIVSNTRRAEECDQIRKVSCILARGPAVTIRKDYFTV